MSVTPDEPISDIARVRRHNMKAILKYVQAHEPVSRADISRASGLSQPTVCSAVDGLLCKGLLCEVGEGSSTGGRPPRLLEFNSTHQHSIGVDLGGTNLRVGITDLLGNLVWRTEQPTPAHENRGPQVVLNAICDAVRRAVDESGIGWRSVGAVGIGAPGATDSAAGIVNVAPAVGWDNTPVAQILSDELHVPVVVDNDVNAAALAELEFGHGREFESFVFVSIGTGIGAGIVIDGKLHRGTSRAAGEIGYMVIDPYWRGSGATEFGCLESMAAAAAISEMARSVLGRSDAGPEDLFMAARSGVAGAADAVGEIALRMAAAFTSITVLIDPMAIIMGGGISHAGDILVEAIRERVRILSPFAPEIRVSALGANAGLVGAAALAISHIEERALE